jgi:hypothetical protein
MFSIPVSLPIEPSNSDDQFSKPELKPMVPVPIEPEAREGGGMRGGMGEGGGTGTGTVTVTGVKAIELSRKSLSRILLLLRLAVAKLSSPLHDTEAGSVSPGSWPTRLAAAAVRNRSASRASSFGGGSLGTVVALYTGRRASLAAAAFLYHSLIEASGVLWCCGVKGLGGGGGARKVGTGRAAAGETVIGRAVPGGAAGEVAPKHGSAEPGEIDAAIDTALRIRSAAFTPGVRNPAEITLVAGAGRGRRLDRRPAVAGGEPRLRQACRARSLLAAAASSLSSFRREVDRNRRISTLASIWSRKTALYIRYVTVITLKITNKI